MEREDILILTGGEVQALLAHREQEILQAVSNAYQVHGAGNTSLPHSLFLRFPNDSANRIIALPAYLGDGFGVAGIKWIASFPGNLDRGLDRASATIILNSAETGRPQALLEGSIISAKRTAASAALGAQALHGSQAPNTVGLVGTGVINFEITRFLLTVFPALKHLIVYDMYPDRAHQFKDRCAELSQQLEIAVADDLATVLQNSQVIAFATTAGTPHISDLSMCAPGTTILHISLRDLTPELILANDNIVDDVDHVCRAQTSVHLAEQQVGNRDFIRGTLADVLTQQLPARRTADGLTIFSPFGLGILDLALSKLVYDLAIEAGHGTLIPSFLPDSWVR
jgi:2,3-diaminopropionate biosynthesis protein SbnB